jgi:MFS family permease
VRRIHYAWVIVGVSFVALLAAQGARLSFGAFVTSWEDAFGASRGEISLISTVSFLVYGATQPLAGRVVDRYGVRTVLSFSVLLVGVALVAASLARGPVELALLYGVIASVGFGGASGVVASVAITRWFSRHRGLAFGLIEAGFGAGQLLLVPGSLLLVDAYGWRVALAALGALAALVVFPAVLRLLRDDPAEVGAEPYGGPLPAAPVAAGPAAVGAGVAGRTPVLASWGFWGLALPFFVCGVTTTGMVDTHLVPFAHDHGHGTVLIGGAVALLAAFNILGTVASGPLADRVDPRWILATLYWARALTIVLLLAADAAVWLLVFGVLFGLVDFATVAPTQVLAAQYFRDHSLGFVFGLVFLAHQLGSALGAWLPGVVHDLTGSYDAAFGAAVVTLVAAGVLSVLLPAPAGRPAAPAVRADAALEPG